MHSSLQQSITATTNCINIVLRIHVQVDGTIKYIERCQIKSIPRNHATATSSSWFDSICLSWVRKAIIALYHSTVLAYSHIHICSKTSQLTTRTINQTHSVIGASQSAFFFGAGEECHPLLRSLISRRSNYIVNWYGYTTHIPLDITLSLLALLHYRLLRYRWLTLLRYRFYYTIGDNVITLSAGITLSVIITLSVVTTRQGISWRWSLAGKSDLWVMLWERISWKPLHWPGWLKANELQEDKGKRSWTGYLPHVEINGTSTKFWKSVETVMSICWSPTSGSWHGTYIGSECSSYSS